jgi:hypothetical protein
MGLVRACGCLAVFSLFPVQAQQSTTTRSSAASATFSYVSDDGCVQNDVSVFANSTTLAGTNPLNTKTTVTYSRYRYDYCADTELGVDMGTNPKPVFSGSLDKALLNASITGTTASGTAVSVSLVLLWEGKGAAERLADRPQNTRAGSPKVIRSENLRRNATVSGTIDGQDVSSGMVHATLHTTQKTTAR